MQLVALTGKARTGKSTIADYLTEAHDFTQVSFAFPLKQSIMNMFSLDSKVLESSDSKETVLPWLGKSPRELMQTLGTEWGRDLVHPNIWIILAERKVEEIKAKNRHKGIVLTDVRFENEADWAKRQGFHLWRVNKQDAQPISSHPSESGVAVSNFDVFINNNEGLSDLYMTVDSLLASYDFPSK